MKTINAPIVKVVKFHAQDVITTSDITPEVPGNVTNGATSSGKYAKPIIDVPASSAW